MMVKKKNSNMCREVWGWNRAKEMILIEDCLRNYRFIAIDTEFPGCLTETSQNATDDERYSDMIYNVSRTKLIQLGLSIFDTEGRIGGVWEINFSDFGDINDARNEKSIEFLRRNGLDFEKIREEGIGIDDFFSEFVRMLEPLKKNITWVTFHGSYDIAYLLKYLSGKFLPRTPDRFSKAVATIFGSVYDLKAAAGRYDRLGNRLGLEKLGQLLGLNRVGTAHHAGSDSELTARVFIKMFQVCDNIQKCEGFVYGLGYRIIPNRLNEEMHNQAFLIRNCYRPPPLPFMLQPPMFAPVLPPFGGFSLRPVYQCPKI